jgi:polyhydroxyalkanoate synthesis repressor PhaR
VANRSAIVIRKYENRRLYDSSASRYVNLEDVALMIREGKDVRVVDAKSGEDLTRVTLTQIITEDARGQPSGLPLELLRQLILATDKTGQEFVAWYLKTAFDAYHKLKDALQSGLNDVQGSALSPLQVVRSLIPGTDLTRQEVDRELKRLRERIAELEPADVPRPKPKPDKTVKGAPGKKKRAGSRPLK